MKMNTRKKIRLSLLLGLWVIFANNSFGQEIPSLYYMNNQPQANGINPAILNDSSKIVLSLPVLSGFAIGLNSTFALSDLLTREGSTLIVDFDRFQQNIPDENYVSQSLSIPLFSIQYRNGIKNISFSINERQFMRMEFNRNLIGFIENGNSNLLGSTFTTDFNFKFTHYCEYALGYSEQTTKKLRIGGRLKILSGLSAIDVIKSTLNIETGANAEFVKFSTEGTTNVSAPVKLVNGDKGKINPDEINTDGFNPGSYLMNFSNLGFAVDFGIDYQINSKIGLSACINDLGTISWGKDDYILKQDGSFPWKGVDLSDATNENSPNSIKNQLDPLKDSLITTFSVSSRAAKFMTSIPTNLSFGGKYTFNSRYSAGILEQLTIYKGIYLNSISVLGNISLGKVFSFSSNYSIIGNSKTNIGLGAAVKLGPVQLYAVTNNILAVTKMAEAKNFNAKMGINLLFGKR
jgi:hypothetical protein